MSEDSSRETPQHLEDRGPCDDCGRDRLLAVTNSGRYCWECLPDEDLARLLDDLI